MAYLSTDPLIPYLRGAIDQDLMGQGGFRSGMEGVTYELSRITGHLVRSGERTIHRILSGTLTRINDRTADAIACALGMTPGEIWPDWYEITTRRVSGYCMGLGVARLGLPLPRRRRAA